MRIIFSHAEVKEGISLYWNDKELRVEPYDKITKHYYCGKELLLFKAGKSVLYTILVVDYDECCCANVFSDGEIKVLFQEHSSVPHKHKKGGQSAQRFQRIRDNEIVQWFKRINEYLKNIDNEIYIGISSIYQKRFIKYLSTYNKEKVKKVTGTEYSNLSGIYQYVKKLETN